MHASVSFPRGAATSLRLLRVPSLRSPNSIIPKPFSSSTTSSSLFRSSNSKSTSLFSQKFLSTTKAVRDTSNPQTSTPGKGSSNVNKKEDTATQNQSQNQNPSIPMAKFSELGATRTVRIVVLAVVAVLATIETMFWIRVGWGWVCERFGWGSGDEEKEERA